MHDQCMNLKAIIHDAEDGGFWAEVPALPGCVTQGESIEEVTANLREAIDGWLAVDVSTDHIQHGARVIDLAV
jgi:predicted RNase H-like HicB family nuclease